MDSRARDIIKQGDALFSQQAIVLNLWQVIAENFFPTRADFTSELSLGENFAQDLFTSYPVLCHRELGNMFAAMLRPREARWFGTHVTDKSLDESEDVRGYLETVIDETMWRAMYDPPAGFTRSTKEADLDYAAFGQAVLRITPNLLGNGLLFRAYHLRDNAWSENYEGKIDINHRKDKLTARQLKEAFPKTASDEVIKACVKEPDRKFQCRHVVLPNRVYQPEKKPGQYKQRALPFTALYIETETETVLEEVGSRTFGYVIPRWQTISGSQYARSPATEIALPDGRTLQAVIRTLREAGEKHVDPPLIAPAEVIRSDLALYAGGVTIYDSDYDEKTGEVLRPVITNPGAMPIGIEMAEALRDDLRHAMYLDKLQLPQLEFGKMTAFEVNRRIQEHVRSAAPLFEPIEEDYNAAVCDETFAVLRDGGAFGPKEAIPEALKSEEIHFTFRSPLRDVADQAKAGMFMEGLNVLMATMQVDPSIAATVNFPKAFRDTLRGIGWKEEWLNDEKMVAAAAEEMKKAATMQKGMEALAGGGQVAEQFGKAGKAINEAGLAA